MTTSDKKMTERNQRMLVAGYITSPEYQKILYNDGEIIQWLENVDEDLYAIHMADLDAELEYGVFELNDLIKALKEFGISLKKE